jgi:acetyltransferase
LTDLHSFFKPSSVAVIGASSKTGKIGNVIVKNIISSGFKGKIFPVNPRDKIIEGLECYPSVTDIKGKADLAVISVPAAGTLGVAEECGGSGVKNLVVITAGFKETGHKGLNLEKELTRICKKYNIRMLGPNCVGMMDTHLPLNASFAANFPVKGDIAFISQSGAMLVAMLDWSMVNGLGFSRVISLGNKADLTESDFILEAARDPETRVILCYIEDVANGEHFLSAAREAASQKPVIILKSGISQAGAQAASSHTGALAGSDLAYSTAFAQTGVIRATTMAELFDLAVAFSRQPIPAGNRVAVITNAGGPGIVTTDRIEHHKLDMARFNKNTIEGLRTSLPAESNVYNPVDVLGDAGADRYRLALEKVMADDSVDSAVVLVCPTAVTDAKNIARVIIDAHRSFPEKPMFAAYMGGEMLAGGAHMLNTASIPCFTFPETAISAIAGMSAYANRKSAGSPAISEEIQGIDDQAVKKIFNNVKTDGRLVLLGSEAAEVMEAYGITSAPTVLATSPEDAMQQAEKLGFPLVMKVASPKILHKTDVGGVKIGIKNIEEVKSSFLEISENVHKYLPRVVIHGIELQKMMPKGVELIIGMTRDVQFGPLMAFGLGGIYVNLLKDVSFRLAAGLTSSEIDAMIAETKASTLLRGYRGEEPADIKAVKDIMLRTARLVTDFPEITEMDINPVFAYHQGAAALDVKITVS